MGRSSQEQAQQNRAKIVEAACRLFRARGVDHVSVADIMGETGMTTGGFYKHFASKDALIAEAFDLAFDQSTTSWQRVVKRERDDAGLRSSALVRHYFQEKPPEQTCPMLAFAPHTSRETSDDVSVTAYANGAKELFTHFVDHMKACQGTEPDKTSNRNAKVLFAAMIGARMLAEAAGKADWVRSVQAAVREAASISQ